jgi:multiple sugar transport system permease protein
VSTSTRSGRRPRRLVVTAVVTLIAIVTNLPIINALNVSFKTDGEITGNPLAPARHPTLEHFANALGAAGYDFPAFFANSTMIACGTVLLVLLIAVPSSYAVVRLGWGGRWLLSGVAGLRLLPAIFFAVPFYLLFSFVGLLDTVAGLVLVNTFLNLPLAMVLLAAGLRDLPVEVEEAAAVDGASDYRILTSVVTPMLAPSLVAVSVLTFLFTWADYLFAVVVSTTRATPVTVGAANFVTSYGIRWGDVSAATLLSAFVPIVFAVAAQRYLVSGLSMGAVKG